MRNLLGPLPSAGSSGMPAAELYQPRKGGIEVSPGRKVLGREQKKFTTNLPKAVAGERS